MSVRSSGYFRHPAPVFLRPRRRMDIRSVVGDLCTCVPVYYPPGPATRVGMEGTENRETGRKSQKGIACHGRRIVVKNHLHMLFFNVYDCMYVPSWSYTHFLAVEDRFATYFLKRHPTLYKTAKHCPTDYKTLSFKPVILFTKSMPSSVAN